MTGITSTTEYQNFNPPRKLGRGHLLAATLAFLGTMAVVIALANELSASAQGDDSAQQNGKSVVGLSATTVSAVTSRPRLAPQPSKPRTNLWSVSVRNPNIRPRPNSLSSVKPESQSRVLNRQLSLEEQYGWITKTEVAPVKTQFSVPRSYDFSKSTNENYQVNPWLPNPPFIGPFAHIRENLDYDYHVRYTAEREAWQDSAIASILPPRPVGSRVPWVIFMSGPMGAGKGHVLEWVRNTGHMPPGATVKIDPDEFKQRMPEWPGYVQRGQDSGTLTHVESGLLAEIAQEQALSMGLNVVVDGSLRNQAWAMRTVQDIRTRFPHYRLGIIFVSAPTEIIAARIRERAERTGRNVPDELVKESIEASSKTVASLTPLMDLVVRIDNSREEPMLQVDGKEKHLTDVPPLFDLPSHV